jgi:hypothetical protein
MDPLHISPAFSYSYQCGSTLMTSYIPVFMYTTSFQILSIFLLVILIFVLDSPQTPLWILKLFPRVCWIMCPENSSIGTLLIDPSRIISTLMNNLILLLSFGLCCPVLGSSVTGCICVNLVSWKMITGRFVKTHRCCLSIPPRREDQLLLILLEQQLEGVSSYLQLCKWPVILTSTLFTTLISWDMAGDKVGWMKALWVPIVGAVILMTIWFWDHLLTRKFSERDSLFPSSEASNNLELISTYSPTTETVNI